MLPPDERRAKTLTAEYRQRFLDEEPIDLGGDFARFVSTTWERMFPFRGDASYEPGYEDSVAGIAEASGRRPEEVAYEVLATGPDGTVDGSGMLYFPLFNYAYGDLELTKTLQEHPRTRMGLSDGGAHCGAVCDGGMPTFMLSYWTRDRTQGTGTLPLEFVVRRQTRETAEFYGLHDRGLLAPGMRADVNVIDYERPRRRPARDRPRPAVGRPPPPAAGPRLPRTRCAPATVTVEDDEFTGALPGRLLRGPR